ncbi:Rieske (2Fe-2S) protein [Tessaracoccus sp. HDW20]|nr:Rieske (2Fe-2S) protein [Tessaracoccus coleopterorum]
MRASRSATPSPPPRTTSRPSPSSSRTAPCSPRSVGVRFSSGPWAGRRLRRDPRGRAVRRHGPAPRQGGAQEDHRAHHLGRRGPPGQRRELGAAAPRDARGRPAGQRRAREPARPARHRTDDREGQGPARRGPDGPRLDQGPESRKDWQVSGILAYSKICTHVGCPISLWERQTHHLLCPCHQSTFDLGNSGVVVFGPAARALPQLPIKVNEEGFLVAQSDFTLPVGPSFFERDSRNDFVEGDN